MGYSPLAAGNWILRNCVWLWFLWCAAMVLALWIGWPLVWLVCFALLTAVVLGTWAALRHVARAAQWCRETFADFPPIWGNPRTPRALLGMILFWIGLLLASGALTKAVGKMGGALVGRGYW